MNSSTATKKTFRVALTADFFSDDGSPKFQDMGLSVLDESAHIQYASLETHQPTISSDQIAGAQGVIVMTPRVTAETVSQSDNLIAIGRFGVGYDGVDVQACTEADVIVFITAGTVDRPVAEATVGWMLGLTHRMYSKDQLVRTGQWDERSKYMGCELRDRTFGTVGLGGIARETIHLLKGFGMNKPLAFDPYVDSTTTDTLGIELVELDELLIQADFVSIHCPLTEATRNLIDERELSLMKPDAYLINTARGGIVNEDALYNALMNRHIAGAAIDCFAVEPVTSPHRFGDLDNVLLAPHSIAWTNELFRDIGQAACQGMVDLSLGRIPTRGVINPHVFESKRFQDKWARLRIDHT